MKENKNYSVGHLLVYYHVAMLHGNSAIYKRNKLSKTKTNNIIYTNLNEITHKPFGST